jgi:hypothetical protein
VIGIGSVAIVVAGFLVWYRIHFAMAPVQGFAVNDASAERHVLIATQGSEFKDRIVAGIVERLRPRSIFIQVIDVNALPGIDVGEWDAILVLHTIEYGNAPDAAQSFVDGAGGTGKIVVLSTSGAGDFTMEGIDAIASASRITDVPARVDELLERVETVLAR